jgi:hypothetical protein
MSKAKKQKIPPVEANDAAWNAAMQIDDVCDMSRAMLPHAWSAVCAGKPVPM